MPDGLGAHIDLSAIKLPPVFQWLQQVARIDDAEMLRTFTCGIGMVVIVDPARTVDVLSALTAAGEQPVLIGVAETGRGVLSSAKGKGQAEAVHYTGRFGR